MRTSAAGIWKASPSKRPWHAAALTGHCRVSPAAAASVSAHGRACRPARVGACGFTLVEILVVIIIIGVVLTAASLSLRADRRVEILREEAERLLALTRLAREEAIQRGQEIGLRFEPDSYAFLGLQGDRWGSLAADAVFRDRTLPPEVTLRVAVEGVTLERIRRRAGRGRESMPDVVIWSSGEITPFRALLAVEGLERSYALEAWAAGKLRLQRIDDKGA